MKKNLFAFLLLLCVFTSCTRFYDVKAIHYRYGTKDSSIHSERIRAHFSDQAVYRYLKAEPYSREDSIIEVRAHLSKK